ncbi:DUF445 domain-containing protein [Cohnella suwonensis]|uniref:DUF445 domain-containing protein n=1 Tax=Cohnella suwonensis TaxID=696072 RepID=A0ABW0M2B2_9BACL
MRSKNIAGLSLVVMGAGFAATFALPDHPGTELLKGGFEAGLVGGFADWFAVTALFRHPMGIPIPHTSLLLKNRDRIAKSLISAFENELLNKESVTRRLRQLSLLKLTGAAVTRLAGKRGNRVGALNGMQTLLAKLPLESFVPSIQYGIASVVRGVDGRELAGKLLSSAEKEKWDERLLDFALERGRSWVSSPQAGQLMGSIALKKLQEAKVGGMLGFAVQAFAGFMNEDKLGSMIQQLLLSAIQDLVQPGHPNRELVLSEIRKQLRTVAEDGELLERGKLWLIGKAESPEGKTFLSARLEQARDKLIAVLEEEKARGGRKLVGAWRFVVRRVQAEPELAESIDRKAVAMIVDAVEANHYRLGALLKDNIDKMDDKALVGMLEEKIGGDLQWIRVNGAVCGFLIGLVLSGIRLAMG